MALFQASWVACMWLSSSSVPWQTFYVHLFLDFRINYGLFWNHVWERLHLLGYIKGWFLSTFAILSRFSIMYITYFLLLHSIKKLFSFSCSVEKFSGILFPQQYVFSLLSLCSMSHIYIFPSLYAALWNFFSFFQFYWDKIKILCKFKVYNIIIFILFTLFLLLLFFILIYLNLSNFYLNSS